MNAGTGRRFKENDQVVNVADLMETISTSLANILLQTQGSGTGAAPVSINGSLTKDYISASTTTTKDYTATPMLGFDISNDGGSNITVTVGGMTFTYLPGETDSRNLESFTSLVITATTAFRCWVRG